VPLQLSTGHGSCDSPWASRTTPVALAFAHRQRGIVSARSAPLDAAWGKGEEGEEYETDRSWGVHHRRVHYYLQGSLALRNTWGESFREYIPWIMGGNQHQRGRCRGRWRKHMPVFGGKQARCRTHMHTKPQGLDPERCLPSSPGGEGSLRPTVGFDVMSLVARSCAYDRGHIEQRVAHAFAVHVATQRRLAERPHYRHPPRSCGSVTAGVHGCPRGLHRSGTIPRSGTTRWVPTGGETTPALHRASVPLLAMASPHGRLVGSLCEDRTRAAS
jgi:hypothetical protein